MTNRGGIVCTVHPLKGGCNDALLDIHSMQPGQNRTRDLVSVCCGDSALSASHCIRPVAQIRVHFNRCTHQWGSRFSRSDLPDPYAH